LRRLQRGLVRKIEGDLSDNLGYTPQTLAFLPQQNFVSLQP